jgi:hypothetical protein
MESIYIRFILSGDGDADIELPYKVYIHRLNPDVEFLKPIIDSIRNMITLGQHLSDVNKPIVIYPGQTEADKEERGTVIKYKDFMSLVRDFHLPELLDRIKFDVHNNRTLVDPKLHKLLNAGATTSNPEQLAKHWLLSVTGKAKRNPFYLEYVQRLDHQANEEDQIRYFADIIKDIGKMVFHE